jgi:hypothetical protein
MGSRAVFVCHENGEEFSPGIYIHWGGDEALDLLRRAAPHMCMYDASEAAARLCGFLHGEIPGAHGVALWPPPQPGADGSVDWERYSPGDWGVVAVDVLDAKAECFAGSLAGRVVRNLPFDQSCL